MDAKINYNIFNVKVCHDLPCVCISPQLSMWENLVIAFAAFLVEPYDVNAKSIESLSVLAIMV
jgi:hypothetical protein